MQRSDFFYDGVGRLLRVAEYTWNGTSWGSATTTKFTYQGGLILHERNNNDAVQWRNTWGAGMPGGIGALLARSTGTGNTNFHVLNDNRGNVVGLVDGAVSPVLCAYYQWDAYGNNFGGTHAQFTLQDQSMQFSTKWKHTRTGYSHYGARFFSPSLGRWINRDPIGEAGGMNLYGFVGNNPIGNVDPWGETGDVIDGIGIGLSIADFAKERSVKNALLLGMDVVTALVPVLPGTSIRHAARLGKLVPPPAAGNASCSLIQNPNRWGPKHGGDEHWRRIQKAADSMKEKNFEGIRVNKRQVNADGIPVGKNRPDVSGINPKTGKRHNIEIDNSRSASGRHRATVNGNDPDAVNTFVVIRKR